MNIESFNRELAKKIAIANSNEKHGELHKAINTWISITEMTLKASKDPNIDSTYRNMLIKKTEQILQHIKELKVRLAIPKPIQESNMIIESNTNQKQEKNSIEKKSTEPKKHEESENPNNQGTPEGFLEIKASNEFKIITPHEELDKNILKDAKKVYKLDSDENIIENQDNDKIIIEQSNDNKKKICFACGTENPPHSKKCKSCNTDLV